MKPMQGLVAALVASGLLLSQTPAQAQQKVLSAAYSSGIANLDPARAGNLHEYGYVNAIYNSLTYIDADLSLKPELAVSWAPNADITSWTFKLRDDVTFHDGRKLTADDVVWTIKRIQDPKTGSRIRSQLDVISDVVAVDPLTVRFDLKFPYSDLPMVLGDYTVRIIPNGHTEIAKQPIGTGPFQFVEFVPGDRLVAKKNPNYWEKGFPLVDEIRLRHMPEVTTAISALEAGTVHLMAEVKPEAIEQLKSSKAATVQSIPSGTWLAYVMNNSKPPFDNIKVRQAFAALVDKNEVIDVASFGTGVRTLTTIPPASPYFLKDYVEPKPDIARAKALLAEAGVSGLNLKIFYPSADTEQERMALALRERAKQIGVNIELSGVPNDKFYAEVEGKESLATTLFFGRPTPDTQTYLWYVSNGSYNVWKYSNPETDKILDSARRSSIEADRVKLYQALQQQVLADVPGIVVYVKAINTGVRNNVRGFRPHPRAWLELKGVSLAN
jgi:peptide/nickel transport system substrate-binding protein